MEEIGKWFVHVCPTRDEKAEREREQIKNSREKGCVNGVPALV